MEVEINWKTRTCQACVRKLTGRTDQVSPRNRGTAKWSYKNEIRCKNVWKFCRKKRLKERLDSIESVLTGGMLEFVTSAKSDIICRLSCSTFRTFQTMQQKLVWCMVAVLTGCPSVHFISGFYGSRRDLSPALQCSKALSKHKATAAHENKSVKLRDWCWLKKLSQEFWCGLSPTVISHSIPVVFVLDKMFHSFVLYHDICTPFGPMLWYVWGGVICVGRWKVVIGNLHDMQIEIVWNRCFKNMFLYFKITK